LPSGILSRDIKVMNIVSGQTGWVAFDRRTSEQAQLHANIVSAMPVFNVYDPETLASVDFGSTGSGQKSYLFNAGKTANKGKHIPTLHQYTGSCVMCGAWAAAMVNSAVDIVVRGDAEEFALLCLLHTYGLSRKLAGIGGQGDGSTGSGMAEALRTGGVMRNDFSVNGKLVLPLPTTYRDSMTWGQANELRYSDYRNAPKPAIAESKNHLVATASPLGNYKEVRDAILGGYACTIACGNPGVDPSKVYMKNGHLFMRPGSRTDHQQALIAVDDDAQNPGVCVINSWTIYCYVDEDDPRIEKGEMDDGSPLGSVWWTPEMIDQAARQGEIYAMGQYNGYPLRKLPYNIISG
jgi:hypothetical protein